MTLIRMRCGSKLYANRSDDDAAVRQEMRRVGPLEGELTGYAYVGSVPATRPIADYTPRIIPSGSGIAVPLEEEQILWQRCWPNFLFPITLRWPLNFLSCGETHFYLPHALFPEIFSALPQATHLPIPPLAMPRDGVKLQSLH
jgi:hypothetical protein